MTPRDRLATIWQHYRWHTVVVACSLVLTLMVYLFATRPAPEDPRSYFRDGQYVWIDGQPYVRTSTAGSSTDLAAPRARGPRLTPVQQHVAPNVIGAGGLQPRQRAAVAEVGRPPIGATIVTEAGHRRRVILPDGSCAVPGPQRFAVNLRRARDYLAAGPDLY